MESSQTQLRSYLWVVGTVSGSIEKYPELVDRYEQLSPHVWRDLHPDQLPAPVDFIPPEVTPYLTLYPHHWHIPQVYAFYIVDDIPLLLLDNVPLTDQGHLLPSLEETWSLASPAQQVYYLWQLLELWTPLEQAGVAESLIRKENIRVQGGRVRLLELSGKRTVSLKDLAESWHFLIQTANTNIAGKLGAITIELSNPKPDLKLILEQLNQTLLEQAGQLPLRSKVAGATDIGVQPNHNEDSYYPTAGELSPNGNQWHSSVSSHLMMVCDGIGGHEGGEVASQLAVQSIRLQVQALLLELSQSEELLQPELVKDQLAALIRVANNLIASRNDEQGRSARRRMGTTLVMALQLPQATPILEPENATGNGHEVYIANIGDSRAYWITAKGCQLLTLDDDVATREVKAGRSIYRSALLRGDASGLTQAMGTKEGSTLHPTIQRLILVEDGILLLCSDGLSDYFLLDRYWANFARPVLEGRMTLEMAVQSLVDLANQKNGHDNISVVATHYGISIPVPVVVNLGDFPLVSFTPDSELPPLSLLTELESPPSLIISEPVLEEKLALSNPNTPPSENQAMDDPDLAFSEGEQTETELETEAEEEENKGNGWLTAIIVLLLMAIAGTVGFFMVQLIINPAYFDGWFERNTTPTPEQTN